MELEEPETALKENDFAIGDSFWLGQWEFEVINSKDQAAATNDEVVFKWQLTAQQIIQLIRDNHPEIKDPSAFFKQYKQDILHDFAKAFEVLICDCGVNWSNLMNDAIDEAVSQRSNFENSCKEVGFRMDEDIKEKLERYLELLEDIKAETEDDDLTLFYVPTLIRELSTFSVVYS